MYPRSAKASGTASSPASSAAASRREPGRPEHREVAERADPGDDGGRLSLVPHGGVVEGAVRLDVADRDSGGAGARLQRADLVQHLVGEFPGVDVDEAAPEAGQVAVGDLGAHRDAAPRGGLADAAHGGGVAGVEPAGDIG
nr:hypothetical protein GCM10020241_50470 [Streptoalloteichus tenebrarius]